MLDDRPSVLDQTKTRLAYLEKEFEDLKYDYSNLNLKYKDAFNKCSDLEKENETLAKAIDQAQQEKLRQKQTFDKQEEKRRHEITQLQELNDHQKQELLSIHRQTDVKQVDFRQQVQALETRLRDYDHTISQYDEYRKKLEANLQKLVKQRDTHKSNLRETRETLTKRDEECQQLKQRLEEYEQRSTIGDSPPLSRNGTIAPLPQKHVQESNLIGSSITPVSLTWPSYSPWSTNVYRIVRARRKNWCMSRNSMGWKRTSGNCKID